MTHSASRSLRALRFIFFCTVILLIGVALRVELLTRAERLHPDEALFATFARSAALNGEWMLPGPLDKPPLTIYITALSMRLYVDDDLTPGLPDITVYHGEFAARFPNMLASVLLIALMTGLARALYRDRTTALLVLALTSLSPYLLAFSATAFTDNFMLLFMVAALWAIAINRPLLSGILLALSLASKQQALFYLPLILLVGWLLHDWTLVRLVRWVTPLVLGVALLTMWDVARAQDTGFWALGVLNNDPSRLLRRDEVWPRLARWLSHGGWLLGVPVVTAALVAVGVGGVLRRLRRSARQVGAAVDVVLLTFALAYGLLHWLVAFNTYDRYLLPLLPPLILLAARGLNDLTQRHRGTEGATWFGQYSRLLILASVSLFLCVSVLRFLSLPVAQMPIGGDRGEHASIDALAAYLDGRDLGAILYDHWLGWELDYYLGEWTDKRRVFYPTPRTLAEDAVAQPDPAPRYFVAPADQPIGPWLDALETAGFTRTRVDIVPGYTIYRLIPPAA